MVKYKAIKVNGTKYDEHRYIMEQFLGRKLSRYEVVHHKDGNKRNNDLNNLEVMLLSDHAREHMEGHMVSEETKQKISEKLKGHKSPFRKLSENQIREIKTLRDEGYSNRKIALMFNVNHQTINDIINGKSYKEIL